MFWFCEHWLSVILRTYFNWPVHIWLFNPQHDLPRNSDTVEEVVDETHIVDECVHVTGAQHQKC